MKNLSRSILKGNFTSYGTQLFPPIFWKTDIFQETKAKTFSLHMRTHVSSRLLDVAKHPPYPSRLKINDGRGISLNLWEMVALQAGTRSELNLKMIKISATLASKPFCLRFIWNIFYFYYILRYLRSPICNPQHLKLLTLEFHASYQSCAVTKLYTCFKWCGMIVKIFKAKYIGSYRYIYTRGLKSQV